MFTPRVGAGQGGGVGIIVLVAIIGILAAVAIPQYQGFITKAKANEAITLGDKITNQMTDYVATNRQLPSELSVVGISNEISNPAVTSVTITDGGVELNLNSEVLGFKGKTIVFQPYVDETENIKWSCNTGTLEIKYLPPKCM
ncbi:MAG: pilin [Gammaproteobacteria bacterium]|nr:pilin [Gammaproteobacteria bacterium]